MSFRPEALRGTGAGTAVASDVDYRLARNLVVSEFHKGRLSRLDVCDAHPELLRAAVNVGQETRENCPFGERRRGSLSPLLLASRLPPSGKCVTSQRELMKLARGARDLACYVVEVCPQCSWNHLAKTFTVGGRRAISP